MDQHDQGVVEGAVVQLDLDLDQVVGKEENENEVVKPREEMEVVDGKVVEVVAAVDTGDGAEIPADASADTKDTGEQGYTKIKSEDKKEKCKEDCDGDAPVDQA